MRAVYHAPRETKKGEIKQAVGALNGNKRLKRAGERDERKAKSKAW